MMNSSHKMTSLTLCPTEDPVPYKKKVLNVKNKPELKKHIRETKQMLKYALCRYPQQGKHFGYGEAYERALDQIQSRTEKMMPEDFPYTFYLIDEDDYEEELLRGYRGPVYWNDFGREFIIDEDQPIENYQEGNKVTFTSLKPIKIFDEGEKKVTVRSLCEAVASVRYDPGNHTFLEGIKVELREIDGVEAITIIFECGS